MKKFEIWLANLDPGKMWPVIVIQANALNSTNHPSTLILPITSKLKSDAFPLRIRIGKSETKLIEESGIVVDQIRAIDNKRLVSKIDDLPNQYYNRINIAMKYVLEIWEWINIAVDWPGLWDKTG